MKKMVLIIFTSSVILSAQITVKKPELVFDQLIGTWQFGSNMEYESWIKKGHIYYANVFSITNGDTTISEKCRIFKDQGKYYYEQQVVLENISNSIRYELAALDEKQMVFENKVQEFPQKIAYKWPASNILSVVQAGTVKGKPESFDFTYKKVE